GFPCPPAQPPKNPNGRTERARTTAEKPTARTIRARTTAKNLDDCEPNGRAMRAPTYGDLISCSTYIL
ncbi:MAG: hypothetical protein FWH20_10945, partial [Oscillospiraceae bacterium]|nr:hypothetical protein [Oscillospiraceae bacterium]